MVNLLYGDYGSGKSTYIIERIKEDYQNGVPSFLIVPEQETVVAERQIASLLDPQAQLFCEVTNFTRLANRVFRDFGGLKYNYISKSAKSLVMYRAICECRPILKDCKIEEGHEKSCIASFLQAINELKTYAVTIGDLEAALLQIEDQHLRNKLENIINVWAVYERIIKDRYDDPLDDAMMLVKKLDEHKYFTGCNVYIDSFYGFTQSQFEIIYRILNDASNVTIAFDCPKGAKRGQMQYAKISESVYRIKELLLDTDDYEPKEIAFNEDKKHVGNDLAYLFKNIWDFKARSKKSEGDVSLALCPDEFSECEVVASRIKELIFAGNKYSDIAIIARDLSGYRGILDFTLKKYDIPFFFSAPSDLMGKPVIKMIFNALSAITTFRAEDIMSYVKCGYLDIDRESEALFEEYIYRWGIYGKRFLDDDYWTASPEGYVADSEGSKKKLEKILNVRAAIISRLEILVRALDKNSTVRDWAEAIFKFLEAHNVVARLEEEKKSAEKADAYIIVQMWEALLSSLDTIVDVCGDNFADPQMFAYLLRYALVDAELSTIPTGEDNVLVAEASMVRAKGVKYVFVIGVNEGSFPASVSDDSFFNDKDKSALKSIKGLTINLSENSSMRADDEYMFFRQSLAIASHGAMISALTGTISGGKSQPSFAFTRIKELLEGVKLTNAVYDKEIDRIYTPTMAREMLGTEDKSLEVAIENALGTKKADKSFSNDREIISEDSVKGYYGDKIVLSQTGITTFLDCRFNYVCKYMLRLRSNKKFSFGSMEIGTLFHHVFEYVLTQLNKNEKDFPKTDDELNQLVKRLTDDYVNEICGGKRISNKLTHLFGRMKTNLYTITKKIVEEYRQGQFKPEYFELSFSGNGVDTPPPLEITLDDGTRVLLKGSADRVDVYRDKENTYVRVIDYKTGSKTFSMALFTEGVQLQLFIYLFGLCEMKDCEFKKKLLDGRESILPAGAYYLPLNIDKLKADKEASIGNDEFEAELLKKNAVPSGRFLDMESIVLAQDKNGDGTYLPNYIQAKGKKKSSSYISLDDFHQMYETLYERVASIATSMKNGDVAALPREDSAFRSTCDYCEYQALCRRRK